MKRVKTLMIVGTALAAISMTVSAVPSGMWNTGVDGMGAPLPTGSLETHYTVTYSATINGNYLPVNYVIAYDGSTALIQPPNTDPWAADPADARWISPAEVRTQEAYQSDPVGFYKFSISFDPGADDVLKGFWATDNTGEIFVNGVSTGVVRAAYDYGTISPFAVYLTPNQVNVLEFLVENVPTTVEAGNPAGLLVSGLELGKQVPDGGMTLVLLGSSLGLLGLIRRKN